MLHAADAFFEAFEPLFEAGVATVILDNTGHSDKNRSRGTSAKGDLNEVVPAIIAEVKKLQA